LSLRTPLSNASGKEETDDSPWI